MMNTESVNNNNNNDNSSMKHVSINYIPIEKLLGSVSYNDIDGTQQLRTSARVFKKMKIESNPPPPPPVPDKKVSEEKPVKDVKPAEVRKVVRLPWTYEEKNWFFEALNEFGRNFEHIHLYIAHRLKKKGCAENMLKSKDHVRLFYSRQWHAIAKHLTFAEGISKLAQELYGLINYGEIRRKIGVSYKISRMKKLNQLVRKGFINVRMKGKQIRILTPMCKALRRLNELDEKYDDIKLPSRVQVELKPKDMASYLKIQSIAQNPRIKVALGLQKRLSSLLIGVGDRWKGLNASIYDNVLKSTNPTTNECVPDQKIIDANLERLESILRVSPPPEVQIDLPVIDVSEYISRRSICLQAYEIKKGLILKTTDDVSSSTTIRKDEKENNSLNTNINDTIDKVIKVEPADCDVAKGNNNVNQVVDEAVNTILALNTHDESVVAETSIVNNELLTVANTMKDERRTKIKRIRSGWTLNNCGTLTIGELYLMFGSDSKLLLEYSWDDDNDSSELIGLRGSASSTNKTNQNKLSSVLQKLLSLAKLQYNKEVITKCNCETKLFKKPAQPVKSSSGTIRKVIINSSIENENAMDYDLNSNFNNDEIQSESLYNSNQLNSQMGIFVTQLNRLKPKFRNKRGRKIGTNQLVVERKLALQPNRLDNKHQLVTMNIVSHSQTNSLNSNDINIDNNNIRDLQTPIFAISSNNDNDTNDDDGIIKTNSDNVNNNIEKLMNEQPSSNHKNFNGLLSEQNSSSALPISIAKILREDDDNQWGTSDVTDFSLSSFLGHLESPDKTTNSTMIDGVTVISTTNTATTVTNNPNAHNISVITTQNIKSEVNQLIDFSGKFTDFSNQITNNEN